MFRLPEDVEQSIYRTLKEEDVCARVEAPLMNRESTLASLRELAGRQEIAGLGPTRVGATSNLRIIDAWSVAAAHYLHAFEHGSQVYPYFADSA